MKMKDWTGNKKSTFSTLGASSHSTYERADRDYYATDPKTIDYLLKYEKPNKDIWEPACGELHLVKPLRDNKFNVLATDIVERSEKIDRVMNFLNSNIEWGGDILTNPPYSRAVEFVEKAINSIKDGNRVYMFLKLTFLEGQKRYKFFQKHPPKVVYVFSKRIQVSRNGDPEMFKKSSAACYAWFVWEKGYTGDPIVKWIN